jgi:hypothetical protein
MIATRKYLVLCFFIGCTATLCAQGVSISDTARIPREYKPEFRRLRNHDAIDAEQKNILSSDGKTDNLFTPSPDDDVNFLITQSLIKRVDVLQYLIETDSVFDHRLKVNYLFGLENMLRYYRQNWRARNEKKVNYTSLPQILVAYEHCITLDRKGLSIEKVIEGLPYDAGTALLNASIFEKNSGYTAARNLLVMKYCLLHPEKVFTTLTANPDVPFADSLIKVAARKYPKELYDYAQANNKLGYRIRNISDDDFVKTIVKMARSKDGQQYFCFLDNILNNKISYEEVNEAKDDSLKYYRLLVKTRIDYVARTLHQDTAYEYETLQRRLEQKAKESFVNIINGLHTEPAEVRFHCIQPLTPQELYYLAVSSDGAIYTSSFVKGVYPLMMKKSNNRGDSLLLSLNFDRYRKFIKMAAEYNTLSDFLNSFPPSKVEGEESDAEKLMRAFVGGLERTNGLESGVDVADSYASIAETLKPISNEMLKNVRSNYKRCLSANNKRGAAIYDILTKLFLSADSSQKIDLTKELGIPPVYAVPYKSLVNDSGRVIMQVFFYGDKDGQGIFKGFLGTFNNSNWKVTDNEEWVTINSVKGKPVSIYANKPLAEEGSLDEKAQKDLCAFLKKNKLDPVVTIHRGHSYTAPYTIEQMSPLSKIVFLGSCGGFMIMRDALEVSPDAHIIATRQIGDTRVNRPFFQLLTERVRTGGDIEWIPFWKELDKLAKSEDFEDYVPPYKNLGALFIKAYKIRMGE